MSEYNKVKPEDKKMIEDIVKYNGYVNRYTPVYPNKYLNLVKNSSTSTKEIRAEYNKGNSNYYNSYTEENLNTTQNAMDYNSWHCNINTQQFNNFNNRNNQNDVCENLSITVDDQTSKISVQDKGFNIDENKERMYKI